MAFGFGQQGGGFNLFGNLLGSVNNTVGQFTAPFLGIGAQVNEVTLGHQRLERGIGLQARDAARFAGWDAEQAGNLLAGDPRQRARALRGIQDGGFFGNTQVAVAGFDRTIQNAPAVLGLGGLFGGNNINALTNGGYTGAGIGNSYGDRQSYGNYGASWSQPFSGGLFGLIGLAANGIGTVANTVLGGVGHVTGAVLGGIGTVVNPVLGGIGSIAGTVLFGNSLSGSKADKEYNEVAQQTGVSPRDVFAAYSQVNFPDNPHHSVDGKIGRYDRSRNKVDKIDDIVHDLTKNRRDSGERYEYLSELYAANVNNPIVTSQILERVADRQPSWVARLQSDLLISNDGNQHNIEEQQLRSLAGSLTKDELITLKEIAGNIKSEEITGIDRIEKYEAFQNIALAMANDKGNTTLAELPGLAGKAGEIAQESLAELGELAAPSTASTGERDEAAGIGV